jgi:phage gp36-like protein
MSSSYVTFDQMQTFFELAEIVQLSNLHNPSATAPNLPRISEAIDWASGIADSYLSIRYRLPLLGQIPLALVSRVADIARYGLDSIGPRADVRQRYEDSIKWLTSIADGALSLGEGFELISPQPPQGLIGGDSAIVLPSSVFLGGGLDGF